MAESQDGWSKWGQHVLEELKRQDSCDQTLLEKVDSLIVSVAKLQGVVRILIGIFTAVIALLIFLLKKVVS